MTSGVSASPTRPRTPDTLTISPSCTRPPRVRESYGARMPLSRRMRYEWPPPRVLWAACPTHSLQRPDDASPRPVAPAPALEDGDRERRRGADNARARAHAGVPGEPLDAHDAEREA